MPSLYYRHLGQGTPLIILHGLFGSSDNWLTMGKKFAAYFSVFIPDQRNHGQSFHTDRHTLPLLTDDLFEFMQQHELDKAHLIGHSMGGKVAMQFSLSYPEKVIKQIIVDIAPRSYAERHDTIFHALLSLNLSAIQKREEADNKLSEKITDPAVRQFLLKNLQRNPHTGKMEWKINLQTLYHDYGQILSGIDSAQAVEVPTLVVKGGRSDYVQDTDKALFTKLFPYTTFVEIPHTGHWVHAEAPEAFFHVATEFLKTDA